LTKYNAKKVQLDGHTFDSKAEARRYCELLLLKEANEIHSLKVHPRYTLLDPFTVKGVRYRGIYYESDFEYVENGRMITEDVKGFSTQVFRIKRKLFLKRWGDIYELRIVEV
jgi:hypothetical protein